MRRHGLKKGLSLLLVFCMILSLLPMTALADEISEEPGAAVEEQSPASGDTTAAGTGEEQADETGETGEATEPADPSAPTEPDTGNTAEPGDGETGEATEPTDPSAPTEPAEPTEPGEGDPSVPADPSTGEQPAAGEEEGEKTFEEQVGDELSPITGEKTPEQIAEEEALKAAEEERARQEAAAAEAIAKAEAEAAAAELEAAFTVEEKKSARDTGDDGFYKIVHLDAGRKYFSVDSIKAIIDNMADAGYNQLELYLSDNQGFRFALDDMTIETTYGTYDLDNALGDGYSDGSKYPDYSGEYLDEADMDEIIAYAKADHIEIVPCINTPGHMGAILEEFPDFRYSGSKSSIDLEDPEAVAFALAIVAKYADYFSKKGCDFFNIGADEYANDMSTMGFQGLYTSGKYQNFVDYLNAAAQIVINEGMTPRAFNDGIYYNNNTAYSINKAIQVCYWSCGWDGYDVASAETISRKGHDMINTNGDYYWVLGNSGWQCSADKASGFAYQDFQGTSGLSADGAMFCIWCDMGNADGVDGGTAVVSATADVITAFGSALPVADSGNGTAEHPYDLTAEENKAVLDGVALNKVLYLTMDQEVQWTVADPSILSIEAVDGALTANYYAPSEEDTGDPESQDAAEEASITAKTVSITPLNAGTTTLTAGTRTFAVTVDPEERTITVAVGETASDFIEGGDYSINDVELDSSIASVSAKYEKVEGGTTRTLGSTVSMNSDGTYTGVISDGTNFLVLDGSTLSTTTDINAATVWTVTRETQYYSTSYTIKSGSYYLTHSNGSLRVSTSSSNWSYDNGFSYRGLFDTYYLRTNKGSWQVSDTNSNNGKLYSVNETTTSPKNGTTVTFTGVSAGTTYVTVGNVHYTIEVVEKAPDNALTGDSLTVEFWITNYSVHTGTSSSYPSTATISAEQAAGGIAIADVAPERAYSFFDGTVTVYYWQAMRLDKDNHQSSESGDDETTDGITVTHVRYGDSGAWEYMTLDGTWHYFESGDQLVAYYLQKTEVDARIGIDIYSKDWGFRPSTSKPGAASGDQVALTIAVVYPDGTVYPAEGDMLANSTTIFNYWKNRDIGIIAPQNNSDYDISKITVTDGTYTGSQNSSGWWTSTSGDVFNWSMATNEAGDQWYDERVVWDSETNAGTVPMVNGTASNEYFGTGSSGNDAAKLVLIYLEPVHYDNNLIVRWVDDSANGAVISTMEVPVTSSETTVTFYNGLKQNSALPQEDTGGTFTLDDDAYVTNSSGANQTFNKTISTVPGVAAQYKSGLYQYISAELSANGMTMTLHYNIDSSKLSKQYVVDFGLPVFVPVSELVENANEVSSIDVPEKIKDHVTTNGKTGITYRPADVMSGMETVSVTVTFNGGQTQTYRIAFIPATTVYYEQGFAEFTGNWDNNASYRGTANQKLEAVGSKKNVYGYDSAYAADGDAAKNNTTAESKTVGDTATFTFTGTGVDIYADCGTDTGTVMIQVTDQNGAVEKLLVVNTAMLAGKTDATNDAKQAISAKNVPIASIEDLSSSPREHTVTITHVGNTKPVYLDGFRVHQTLKYDTAAYVTDGEFISNMVELRDLVILNVNKDAANSSKEYKDQITETVKTQVLNTGAKAVLIMDTASDAGINPSNLVDVLDKGPKNEIYLGAGEKLVFNVGIDAQVGVKCLTDGAAGTVNGTAVDSQTDMFYAVNAGIVTIANTGKGTLAVTELKFCS